VRRRVVEQRPFQKRVRVGVRVDAALKHRSFTLNRGAQKRKASSQAGLFQLKMGLVKPESDFHVDSNGDRFAVLLGRVKLPLIYSLNRLFVEA